MIDISIYKHELYHRKRGNWDKVWNKQGIYIFTHANDIIYIGRSSDLYTRLVQHYSKRGICNAFDWDTIHFIFTDNHKQLEKYLINKYSPLCNGNLTSRFY
jgi:excinuclease UvrABC nuclease subunit